MPEFSSLPADLVFRPCHRSAISGLLSHLTPEKVYTMSYEDGVRTTIDDAGVQIVLSNKTIKRYFTDPRDVWVNFADVCRIRIGQDLNSGMSRADDLFMGLRFRSGLFEIHNDDIDEFVRRYNARIAQKRAKNQRRREQHHHDQELFAACIQNARLEVQNSSLLTQRAKRRAVFYKAKKLYGELRQELNRIKAEATTSQPVGQHPLLKTKGLLK
jgi:hypothetical protein